jgi:hypothetical protein
MVTVEREAARNRIIFAKRGAMSGAALHHHGNGNRGVGYRPNNMPTSKSEPPS